MLDTGDKAALELEMWKEQQEAEFEKQVTLDISLCWIQVTQGVLCGCCKLLALAKHDEVISAVLAKLNRRHGHCTW